MFCRSISWIICTLVPVVLAADCSDQHSISGSDTELMVCPSRTVTQESSTRERGLEVKQTAPVHLGMLLDAGEGAVVTLVAGNTRLVAHRAVLVASSHVFATMLRHDRYKASSDQVSITDVEGPVLHQLLAYMYSLHTPQLHNISPQVLAAAKRYGLSGLDDVCKQQVAGQLSVENAAAAAVHALRHSCPSLKQAVAFIKANTHRVMTTQGWEDAVISHPHSVVELTRLIAEPPDKTSGTAGTESGPTTSTDHQTHSHHSWTPDRAEPPPTAHHTPSSDENFFTRMWNLSGKDILKRLMRAYERGAVGEELSELLVDMTARYWFWFGQTILLLKPTRRHVVKGLKFMLDCVVMLLILPLRWFVELKYFLQDLTECMLMFIRLLLKIAMLIIITIFLFIIVSNKSTAHY